MSSNIIRVAIPPYDATTDTDPDHFALVGDQDWVLIKEKERDSITITASSNATITHDLGYIPLVFVYLKSLTDDSWMLLTGNIELNTTQLIITNTDIVSRDYKYYLFYDQQV